VPEVAEPGVPKAEGTREERDARMRGDGASDLKDLSRFRVVGGQELETSVARTCADWVTLE